MSSLLFVITGASVGIGKATAKLCIDHGHEVVNLSRRHCDIAGVNNLLTDLNDEEAIRQAVSTIAANQQPICLVHCAAMMNKDSTTTIDSHALEQSLQVNIIAPALLNTLLIPQMTSGSSIIFIGSTLSEKAVKNTASYIIAKHAVVGMMRAACQDLDNSGIHTCCICPGFTDTEMLREHVHHDESVLAQLRDMVCAHRLIEPQEIAELIEFAATHPVLNGAVIHGNLGQIER